MASQTEITVRYAETDCMGVVHHAVYPVWYEVARTDYIKALG
ncbi:MAG: acyl-CoA thioesterase, partial [Oscillospiraceae bacterium]|nr:acyl-CoA thioesterase [Oscillospiraceae bacterium]